MTLPGLADRTPEDLAVVNLQDMYERGLLRFDNEKPEPLTLENFRMR